jgi:hypothetical protein
MIPQTQSRTGPTGRCFPACLASILEVPEASVPDFMDEGDEDFLAHVNQFLARFGLSYKQVPVQDVHPVGWHTVEGLSPRGGQHAVVGRDGRMVWDPHPQDGTGRFLVKPEIYGLLLKTGRAKDMEVERVPNVGEKIQLPSGKKTTVQKVASATDLFGRPEFHVLTTTGEVLPVTVKEK